MRPRLKTLQQNGDFRLAYTFSDGLQAELDFREHIFQHSGPVIDPLRDKSLFSQAFIDHGVLTWPNGYDVCPDVLRVWAEAGSILTQSETDRRYTARQKPVSAAG